MDWLVQRLDAAYLFVFQNLMKIDMQLFQHGHEDTRGNDYTTRRSYRTDRPQREFAVLFVM